MIGFSNSLKNESGSYDSSNELPSPPWVQVEGIDNFIDIGGYALGNESKRSFRRNFCFRCADPARVNANGKAKIQSLGISTVFDLRSAPEIVKNAVGNYNKKTESSSETLPTNYDDLHSAAANAPSPFDDIPTVTRHFTPVFLAKDFSPENMARGYAHYMRGGPEGFTAAYQEIMRSGPSAFTTVFTHIRDKPSEPFVFHCSAGKDRTGVLSALMMNLVGVEDEVIATEYELTETGLAPMKPFVIAHLMKEPALQANREGVERMVSARKENMLAFLTFLKEEYGGSEGYLKNQCGFSDADLAVIRKNLVDDVAPVINVDL